MRAVGAVRSGTVATANSSSAATGPPAKPASFRRLSGSPHARRSATAISGSAPAMTASDAIPAASCTASCASPSSGWAPSGWFSVVS
ncbi:MAG TPA: hypothetical protein VLJ80_06135 [Solirubrobacteraceae bacterium]|nr:hypothetical protein [Solirubrobacteraceae bacterium]